MAQPSLKYLALVALFVAPTAVFATLAWQHHDRAEHAQAQYVAERRAAVAHLASLRNEAELGRSHADAFARLAAAGTVGVPDKLAAIDRIEAALTPWHDEVVRFTLGGSRPVDGAEGGQHALHATRLDLDLVPRHEASLLALLAAVRSAVPGVADVERCDIRPRGEVVTEGLAAACSLTWHAYVPRSGEPAEGQVAP